MLRLRDGSEGGFGATRVKLPVPRAESPFDTRSDGKPFAGFLIVNDVLARPECGQRFDSLPCVLWGLHSFYEKEFSAVEQVAEHNEDAKGAWHPSNSVLTRDMRNSAVPAGNVSLAHGLPGEDRDAKKEPARCRRYKKREQQILGGVRKRRDRVRSRKITRDANRADDSAQAGEPVPQGRKRQKKEDARLKPGATKEIGKAKRDSSLRSE